MEVGCQLRNLPIHTLMPLGGIQLVFIVTMCRKSLCLGDVQDRVFRLDLFLILRVSTAYY
jgi:hypothetical protein